MKLFKVSKINGVKSECEVATEAEVKFLMSHGWKSGDASKPAPVVIEPKAEQPKKVEPTKAELRAQLDEIGVSYTMRMTVVQLKELFVEPVVEPADDSEVDIDL